MIVIARFRPFRSWIALALALLIFSPGIVWPIIDIVDDPVAGFLWPALVWWYWMCVLALRRLVLDGVAVAIQDGRLWYVLGRRWWNWF